jgi:hypothetical protein
MITKRYRKSIVFTGDCNTQSHDESPTTPTHPRTGERLNMKRESGYRASVVCGQ